jgi:hypothetical protein
MEDFEAKRDLEIQNLIAEMIRTDQDIRDLERQTIILKAWHTAQQNKLDRLRTEHAE